MKQAIINSLCWLATKGRLVLVVGLICGIALPDLAQAMRPWLAEMVIVLLFIAAMRVGTKAAFSGLGHWKHLSALLVVYQTVLPLLLIGLFYLVGFSGPLATALILMASASSIFGSANLTVLVGRDPAPALRLLILGTAIMPLTVLPVFWLLPELNEAGTVLETAIRLLLVITLTSVIAFATRHWLLREPDAASLQALDGLSVLVMAIVVIGLMSAISPALNQEPMSVVWALILAFLANFGCQIIAWWCLRSWPNEAERPALAIVAGNRNMGLFLTALPASIIDPLLLFIGCYQVPMYLTPLLLGWLYKDKSKYPGSETS